MFNFFHRAFWPYQKIIEVQGSKMFMNPNENSYNMRRTLEDYASNLVHEKATTDLFKKTVKNGDVVVDLGANIGYFSLLASRLTGSQGKVFSFEPEPKNYNYLKKNIELNNYNHAQPFQKAVSDKNGTTKLFICDYDTGHHTINKQDGIQAYSRGRIVKERSIDIETVALDNFLKERTNRVDVIKMDVEGAEMLALSGMDRVLKDNKDIKMIVEFFPLLIEKMGSDPKEFIRRLIQDYGFSIYIIPEDYAALTSDMKKLNSIQDVMSYRKNEEDHINLFLQRE
ncbi:MAG: hypothetical protein A3F15_00330 [Candidatus Wildermuthbacteria bacterium RIFCSPHIGHO2_12_FULL_40_12]|uniref:Methyltransferase FkbM domain-containing protein n=1 Tax=Candidatus Wildermuthbacteria bacterium RIFCSPHIGHO2_12_FULL_40_12 TaxID=1802457 RepID=A0A1G2RD36_9BACT|nr:MAG: hypothetical protein A3F15_00330 [Candidatus Wildermuthbacteria bacterium RIFCSPHIGHO2_12_FULL_40_12]